MPGLNSIEGLASGLNTTDIINATIALERQPAVLMESRQAEKTNELTSFKALSAKLLALLASINTLNNRNTFNQASVSVSDNSLLSASADGDVSTGVFFLNILSLAKNHRIASQGFGDLSSLDFGTGSISISLGNGSSTVIDIDQGQNSLAGIKDAINEANLDVSAAIINDGTGSNPYRLVLSGSKTGLENKITITSSLTGGLNLDFTTTSFDNPEILDFSGEATSLVNLGATASYTGTTNKSFTFTVGGTGVQTLGVGNIRIDWEDSDGNTGYFDVDQADKEIVIGLSGHDGMKLSFTAGDLVAGDTFKVSTFAPLLQQASDAQVSIGSSENGASPIVISSDTNTFKDVIPGVTLDIKNITTESTGPVSVSTGLNTAGIVDNINIFIKSYNDVMTFIDSQNEYNSDTNRAGVLLGDQTILSIQSRLRSMISNPIDGLDRSMNTLSSIGIRTNTSGKLVLRDSSKLNDALKNDFDSVMNLFVDSGTASINGISFLTAADEIKGGTIFDVDITSLATHGYYQGQNIGDPATSNITLTSDNNKLKFRVDGLVSDEITLTARTYSSTADLINEIQTKINADAKIGNRGVDVEWVDTGDNAGYIKLTSSGYGSTSNIDLVTSQLDSAFADLGLAMGSLMNGQDVVGTINGESATGQGQVLTGDKDNETTAGLKLKITLTAAQLVSGDEGTITITRGVASVLGKGVHWITDAQSGVLAYKTRALETQINDIKEYIEDFDERLMLRRERLVEKWTALEIALSQFQVQGDFLTSQLAQISSNFSTMFNK